MSLLLRIIRAPTIAKMVLKVLKNRAFKPYQIPLEKALEKQDRILEAKFKRMEGTEIGKKLGVYKGVQLRDLPVTEYSFYEPFYNNPSQSAFMYPLKDYIKVKTSGTAGKEKWFMIPQKRLRKSWETGISIIFTIFHDGEKVTLEYGDNFYVNVAPRPFISGAVLSAGGGKNPFFNIMPNFNLPYKDKIQYFINNHENIDGAALLASALISQIIPAIEKPIQLKGLQIVDAPIGEIYRDEIERFAGTIPKSAYGSTETGFCSVPSVQHPLGFFFDWRRGVFEFVPVKKGKTEKEPIPINEVKVGEIYRLIYTDLESELTRYDMKDSLKCVAKGDDSLGINSPIFKFHARLEKAISLQNFTRINEEELLTVFKEVKIQFIDFTARVEIEKGLEHLGVYIEHTGDMMADDIRDLIHKQLYKKDRDYRDLVDFFGYLPIKVRLMPRGVFARYLEEKTATLPKVDRINMDDKEFKRLIQLMKNINLKS